MTMAMTVARPDADMPMAAQVDSSWYNHPSGGRKYHVVFGGVAGCSHQPTSSFTAVDLVVVLADDLPRCGRQPCKRWFEIADSGGEAT